MTSVLGFKVRVDSLTFVLHLRFTSGLTPANLLVASMEAKSFYPHTCIQALVGLESRIKCAAASQHVTSQTLYRHKFCNFRGKRCTYDDNKISMKISLFPFTF